ncbi:class I SAM-dependent RNA methyltransferase [Aestuariibius insulae]|uniref:class I SAM-dependent RNA methyltransferase n=1 Tax=Aestuariibius insulae TaxID=2058287 RepID=UPI00345EED7B
MQQIIALTHHGLGRAIDGTLIPRTLPGEVVEDERIITPSSDRVRPPCRHFKSCGGCVVQHASDAFVAEWKTDIIRVALAAQGLETEIRPILTSPPKSRRRAKLSGRRTKAGALVGFHRIGSDQIVSIPDCQLITPALLAGMDSYEEITRLAASRKTEIALTVTEAESGLDILVQTERPLTRELREDLSRLAGQNGLARLVWNDEPVYDTGHAAQTFGTVQVIPPPGAFLQATQSGEDALFAAALEAAGPADHIADLFCGCGTFSLRLSERSAVHAIEGDADMVHALERGARQATGLKPITTEVRDLFRRPLDTGELRKFDAVVIDPPRPGAAAQMAELAKGGPPRIASLSCNPATFARDTKVLTGAGYTLDWVQPIDQFRWAAHVELAAQLTRC